MAEKQCLACGRVLPLDDRHFAPRGNRTRDGYSARCHDCLEEARESRPARVPVTTPAGQVLAAAERLKAKFAAHARVPVERLVFTIDDVAQDLARELGA